MPYETSERVEQLAADLIAKHHPHLANVKIAYLVNLNPTPAKAPRLGKKRKLGSSATVPEKFNALCGYDFVIEIRKDLWDRMNLETQEALLDHELCHCGLDDNGCYIRDHDVTEFREILDRHGFWLRDLKDFYDSAAKVAQGSLFPEPKDAPPTSANKPVTIDIDLDASCAQCGKKGATKSGLCLECGVKHFKGFWDRKKKKERSEQQIH